MKSRPPPRLINDVRSLLIFFRILESISVQLYEVFFFSVVIWIIQRPLFRLYPKDKRKGWSSRVFTSLFNVPAQRWSGRIVLRPRMARRTVRENSYGRSRIWRRMNNWSYSIAAIIAAVWLFFWSSSICFSITDLARWAPRIQAKLNPIKTSEYGWTVGECSEYSSSMDLSIALF